MDLYINAISLYRIGRFLDMKKLGLLARLFDLGNLVLFSAVIPRTARIGAGTICEHRGIGVIIHPDATIGRNCRILPHVVVGGRGGRPGAPIIGDGVLIGAGAKLLGPVQVGNDATIASGAIVVTDVPAKGKAIGPKATVSGSDHSIKHRTHNRL